MFRSLLLLSASTAITIMLVLGIARLPGGERVAAMLARASQIIAIESFEDTLRREVSALRHQELRKMMLHLVILHIAKQAREARQEVIGGRQSYHWLLPAPTFAVQANQSLQTMRGTYDVRPAPITIAAVPPPASSLNLWPVLACFGLAGLWVWLRRV